jgi:hypothetical protein
MKYIVVLIAMLLLSCGGNPSPTQVLGDPCDISSQCIDGLCLTELPVVGETFDFPGGFCTHRCGIDTWCTIDEMCIGGGEFGHCFPICGHPDDCRTGYACWFVTWLPLRFVCFPERKE